MRRLGCTALFVEHHVDRFLGVVDRAVVLSRGAVALDLTAAAARPDRSAVTTCAL